MKKLTRERAVPIISARVSCEVLGSASGSHSNESETQQNCCQRITPKMAAATAVIMILGRIEDIELIQVLG
jgi:hypothetical protein